MTSVGIADAHPESASAPLLAVRGICVRFGGIIALNGISSSFRPIAFGPDDMLLWSLYARFEPAFAGQEEFGELIAQDDEMLSELMADLGLKEQ